MPNTPDHILKRLRQRSGFEASDMSDDARLEALSPMQKLRAVVAWELGSEEWADQFLTWAKECGIELEDPR